MNRHTVGASGALAIALLCGACGSSARLPVSAGVGPTPELPSSRTSLIPTVNVADDARGIKGWFFTHFQQKAGDGVAEARSVFLDSLYPPFGMVLVGSTLFVATSDALMRFPYVTGETHIIARGVSVAALPAGPINHHWTRNVVASADGSRLYVSVGSHSNAADNGIDKEVERASIWEIDPTTGRHRILASGLRNPVGMAWNPESGALWVAVNERDELGSDIVPDSMTAVRDGGFYGWPYSYFGTRRGICRRTAGTR